MHYEITSPANDRIKWLVRLRDRRHRDSEGVFIVEGERLYQRAIDAGLVPRVTFVSTAGVATTGETVAVAPEALDRASYRSRSRDVLAVFDQMETRLSAIDPGQEPLLLVAENIEKPGNLGAIARSAAAAGASALITVGKAVDPWNPNALRSSTGAIFSLPIALTSWDELEPWLNHLRIPTVAASPDATLTVWQTDLTGPVALVIGAEDQGLSERASSLADARASIPQAEAGVDSLNASVSAGIFLFEAVRQRTADTIGVGRQDGQEPSSSTRPNR